MQQSSYILYICGQFELGKRSTKVADINIKFITTVEGEKNILEEPSVTEAEVQVSPVPTMNFGADTATMMGTFHTNVEETEVSTVSNHDTTGELDTTQILLDKINLKGSSNEIEKGIGVIDKHAPPPLQPEQIDVMVEDVLTMTEIPQE